MDRRFVYAGLGLLAVATVLAATWGVPVTLRTGSLSSNPAMVECYTSGILGDLVTDDAAGTAILDPQENGRRVPVTWPLGWTGRRTVSGVEVLDTSGNVKARTGTRIYLMGGSWTDDSFLTCGPAPQ